MHRTLRLLAAACLALTVAACATMMPGAPARMADGVLVDSAGMTLYTFDRDVADSGKSVCNGPCATNWPPLLVGADPKPMGAWTVITRDDGSKQWALKGKPLYRWSKDGKPGDKTGDGFNSVWHVAKE
jgi:predicted lipoprotein with Yx(FWY)xxD motif